MLLSKSKIYLLSNYCLQTIVLDVAKEYGAYYNTDCSPRSRNTIDRKDRCPKDNNTVMEKSVQCWNWKWPGGSQKREKESEQELAFGDENEEKNLKGEVFEERVRIWQPEKAF